MNIVYSFSSSFAAYGQGQYGCGAYSSTTQDCTTTGGGSNTSGTGSTTGPTNPGSGALVNTGTAVLVFVTVACLIIFAALIVRIWRHSPRTDNKPQGGDYPAKQTTKIAPRI